MKAITYNHSHGLVRMAVLSVLSVAIFTVMFMRIRKTQTTERLSNLSPDLN